MKKQVFKTTTFLFILIFSVSAAYGQNAEKVISKNYQVQKGFTLGIDNSYGEINIVNWDKNELSVEVRIETESTTQSKAEELLDRVTIGIDESRNEVNFSSEFENKAMTGKNKIRVIYKVKAPSYINANLEQRYGNVYLQEINGIAKLEVKYGNLTAGSLGSESREEWNILDLAYGNASIDFVTGMQLEVKYSDLSIRESYALVVESAYSKMGFGKVGELSIDSKYDKLSVDELSVSLEVDAAYTHVSAGTFVKGFKSVSADMAYGNFKGVLGSGVGCSIDAEVTYGSLNIPEGDYEIDKGPNSKEVHGTIGSPSDSRIEVDLKYGNLNLD